MANALQLRRGTTTQHNTFTGLAGEVTVDTDKNTAVVHDGSTAGGFPLAKTADISTEVAALVDSAPSTLDTLNELAAALGDDPNFATTVTNSIATKMPLAGGTFTGDVAYGDNVKATFGAGSDLQIYHTGSDSYVEDAGTGNLYLKGSTHVRIVGGDDSFLISAASGGSVFLYEGGNTKLTTTATGVDITGTAVTDGVTVDGTLDIEEVYEKVSTSSATSGTIDFITTAQGVFYFTANQTANRTINFTNVNSNLSVGQSVTCTVLLTQGSTAYYLNAYQVDGSAVTPKWSGGSAPTEGNASGIDVYTFTIIKTANATFTVLASVTQFA